MSIAEERMISSKGQFAVSSVDAESGWPNMEEDAEGSKTTEKAQLDPGTAVYIYWGEMNKWYRGTVEKFDVSEPRCTQMIFLPGKQSGAFH